MKNDVNTPELSCQGFSCGNEKEMMDMIEIHETPLPYPTSKLRNSKGEEYESYQIPMEDKAKLLKEYYPFIPVPKMEETLLDIHENKLFTVKEFLIVREKGRNYLVSPYYPHSFGTVLDWVSPESNFQCFVNAIKPDSTLAKEKSNL